MFWMKPLKCGFALMMLATGTAGISQTEVEVTKAVYIEHVEANTGERSVSPAERLARGDRVIMVMDWQANRTARGFTLLSPVPSHLSFRGADGNLQVSADGGATWGVLGKLRHRGRTASPSDITHLRWRIAGSRSANGSVTYSAVVR